jgi:O-antigen/teichoic acid export membrane protein
MSTAAEMPAPAADDVLASYEAGGKVIRGSAWRVGATLAGIALGLGTATLLLRYLGVAESGRYVTVMSLVAIPVYVCDMGLNVSSSRELALRGARDRSLLANILGQRLVVMPVSVVLIVCFAIAAGYPSRMVLGTVLAGTGATLVAVGNALLLCLTVELRNAGLALVDFTKQAVGLVGVALLVVAGAQLTTFFAVQLIVGVAVLALVPLLTGPRGLMLPRFDRDLQRLLFHTAFPMAMALALAQVYFRLVIVLMSLISTPQETGYYGGSLRAMENLVIMPIIVAGVALPLLAAAARDDPGRMRRAVEGLGEGAVIAGVFIILVTIRAAQPVMVLIGGQAFRPAGAVLRIQVVALLFIGLYQLWTAALLALGHQRDLIFTNAVALVAVGVFAALLIPELGARGGATASVLGDALLASLIYWRLARVAGSVMVSRAFLVRVAAAAAVATAALFIPGIPELAAAALAGALFLAVGQAVGMVRPEVHEAFALRRLLQRRALPPSA